MLNLKEELCQKLESMGIEDPSVYQFYDEFNWTPQEAELIETLSMQFNIPREDIVSQFNVFPIHKKDEYYVNYDKHKNTLRAYFSVSEDAMNPIYMISATINGSSTEKVKIGKCSANFNHLEKDGVPFDKHFPILYSDALWDHTLTSIQTFSSSRDKLKYYQQMDQEMYADWIDRDVCKVKIERSNYPTPEAFTEFYNMFLHSDMVCNLANDVYRAFEQKFPHLAQFMMSETSLNKDQLIETSFQKIKK